MILTDVNEYTKVQVIGLPRTCSSYLSNSINIVFKAVSNQNCIVLGEPIQNGTNKEINNYFALIKNKNVKSVKHHIDQFAKLIKHPDYKRIDNRFYNIGIIRNSIFDLALSLSVAMHTTQFSKYTYSINDKIKIDKHEFVSCLFFQIQRWELFVNLKDQFNEIVYSDNLTFDPIRDTNNLQLFSSRFSDDLIADYEIENFKAPDKFKVVTNYTELYNITLDFLAEYFNPLIEVTGVNFELRQSNSARTANRVGSCANYY